MGSSKRALAAFALLSSVAAAQQYVISTYAGGVSLPTSVAVNAAIGPPQSVATDAAGNLYFAGLHRIFKLDPNGLLTLVAGTGTSGSAGDGGPAIRALLGDSLPALAVDRAGNLYFADATNGVVRKISPAGIITRVAGNGPGWYTNHGGDGEPATSVPLYYPWQLAVDADGSLYIGTSNTPRIHKVSPNGIITTAVGNGKRGYSGDGGAATDAMMGSTYGLAFDSSGNLYFSDNIPGDDYAPETVRVRRVSPDGIITTVAGTGAPGDSPDTGDGGPATSAQFAIAGSLAVDSAGNLYISDYSRIRKVSPDGIITTIAGTGQSGFSGDGGPATSSRFSTGSFYGPGLATDRVGNLYLADGGNNRVRRVSPAGTITTVAGNGNRCCYSGDDGAAISAQLYVPVGVVMDRAGSLYIADTFNNRIRKVSPAGIITTVAGGGISVDPGDGGPATDARLAWPAGLALDGAGNLYTADTLNNRIRMISNAGIITTVAGNGGFGDSGDGGPATSARLLFPKDVAIDGSGNLYIADTHNNRVRMVSPAGIISTVAGKGHPAGYSGDGGPAVSAHLNQPSSVAIDRAGNLYVADTENHRVRKVSTSGTITTVAGYGLRGYSGDGGSATSAQLIFPVGVKIDSAGNLYIGDGAAVRMVSPAGIITTVAGNGTSGYSGDGGPATSAQTGAWGLAFDSAGNLYVADTWNNAIRLLKSVSSPVQ